MIDSLFCGGAEKSLISLLPCLAHKGYEITLMIQRRGGELENLVPKGIKLITFPYYPKGLRRLGFSIAIRLPFKSKYTYEERMWKSIGRYYPCLEEKFDVAIAYQQGFPTLFIADKVTARKKICWINCDIIKAGYNKNLWHKIYKKFDNIVTVTNILADILTKENFVLKDKILIINDIVSEDIVKSLAKERVYIPPKNKLIITTVGRFSPIKGYDYALDAALILKNKGINFEWNFIGDGPTRPIIEDFIKRNDLDDYIKIRGLQLNPYPFIEHCDIYVQPSRSEGYGITICEAKILQKPIVSTNFPVVHFQINNGINGLVADMNGKSIAENIYKLANDSSLRMFFSQNLRTEHNRSSITESRKVIDLIDRD